MLWDVSQAYGQFLVRSGVVKDDADVSLAGCLANGRFDKRIKKALGASSSCGAVAAWVSTKAVSNSASFC